MRITSYGLFWDRELVDWNPGKGNRGAFRLLGRHGEKKPKLRICDFRFQQGIYVLYNDYGSYYVGLARQNTTQRGLGQRLKEHTTDKHSHEWTRFSWFGFNPLLKPNKATGVCGLTEQTDELTEDTCATIADLETLIIRLIDPRGNGNKNRFRDANRWEQVGNYDMSKWLSKVQQ